MKKLFPLLSLSALLMSCNTPATTPTSDISGLWQGDYNCGKAQLKLDIQSVTNGQVQAAFNFGYYSNTTTKTINPDSQGAFALSGTFQNNVLGLKAGNWITYPKSGSWVPLDVNVTYDTDCGKFAKIKVSERQLPSPPTTPPKNSGSITRNAAVPLNNDGRKSLPCVQKGNPLAKYSDSRGSLPRPI